MELNEGTLEESLIKVDALAKRWAAADYQKAPLHPLEAMRLLHDGAVFGAGAIPTPDDVIKFDECMFECPEHHALIVIWYQSGGSVKQKARRLGIGRTKLYDEHRGTLKFIKGWLKARGLDV